MVRRWPHSTICAGWAMPAGHEIRGGIPPPPELRLSKPDCVRVTVQKPTEGRRRGIRPDRCWQRRGESVAVLSSFMKHRDGGAGTIGDDARDEARKSPANRRR